MPHIPSPRQLAGCGVVASDDPGRRVLGLSVLDLSAHHGDAAHDRWRRGDRVPARDRFTDALRKVYTALLAEIDAGFACLGVHRDQSSIEGPYDDPGGAGLIGAGTRHREIGNAAAACSVRDSLVGN